MDEKQVIEGPDLNSSRSTLDEKQYRQIILGQNGLRVILISDTHAMIHQNRYEYYNSDDEEDGDHNHNNDDDDGEEEEKGKDAEDNNDSDDDDDDEDDDDEDDDDGIRKAAAAMVVGAGSFHDPPFAQGMAHFLEHMLFMGTAKYPGENEYLLLFLKMEDATMPIRNWNIRSTIWRCVKKSYLKLWICLVSFLFPLSCSRMQWIEN